MASKQRRVREERADVEARERDRPGGTAARDKLRREPSCEAVRLRMHLPKISRRRRAKEQTTADGNFAEIFFVNMESENDVTLALEATLSAPPNSKAGSRPRHKTEARETQGVQWRNCLGSTDLESVDVEGPGKASGHPAVPRVPK